MAHSVLRFDCITHLSDRRFSLGWGAEQGVSGTALSRAKSHNTDPLNQPWRCLFAVQGEARSCSWAEQEQCSSVLIQTWLPGPHREMCTFHLCSWKLRFQDEGQKEWAYLKPPKLSNFPSIKTGVQTRRRWLLLSLSSHLKKPIHKNMRLHWGMCIKFHFVQCEEAQQGLNFSPLSAVGHSSS